MRLAGKTAIVTGAGSGFGAGIAEIFVAEGARVLVADVNGDAANAVAKRLNASPWVVDVTDNTSVRRMAGKLPNPDIIVNNAGITHLPQPLDDISDADFDRIIAVNMKSVYLMARHFIPKMKTRGSGTLLNIAATAGVSPRPNLTWYNASKGWMITATKSMAAELAPYGIRVNALNPVAGETPLLPALMGEDTPEARAKVLSTIPLGRLSTPHDIGEAAAFLCSDAANMITGIAMDVDGGHNI
ncbi:MAG: glucose 1-dehydrogenase [Octadecabacter sp.]